MDGTSVTEETSFDDFVDLDFAPWDGRRVPVTLLGGYLGAGKTTVLNELLARADRPIAVFVNDLGAVNIDADLVAARHGDTIDLTDGCVCCSLSGGLVEAFDTLRGRPEPPDHVVIELSGVADPHRVVPWAGITGFRLDGVVVLVDVDQFRELEQDAVVGDAVRRQLEAADLFVLTKLDLAGAAAREHVSARLRDLVPGVPIVSADTAAAAGVIGLATRRAGGVTALPEPSLFDVHDASTIPLPRPIARADLDALIADLPDDTLRAKGVALAPDGSRLLIQVVGRRRSITELPGAEDQLPTDLVVIRRK